MRRIAVTAQVGGDHRKAFGERGRDLVPDRAGLRMAVQQQKRRSAAARHRVNPDAVDRGRCIGKAFEHGCLPRLIRV
jgi:hypothetical protein